MKILTSLLMILLSLSLVGCGDDDGPVGNDNTNTSTAEVNEQAAGIVAGTAFAAAQLAQGDNGQSAAFSLMAVGVSALSLVSLDGQPALPVPLDDLQRAAKSGEPLGGGCDCTPNSCVFTGCGNGSGFSITGAISWTDTSLDADYTVSGSQAGQEFTFSVFADVDYTPNSITGVIATDGQFVVNTESGVVTSSWDTSVTFNSVTYTDGQPTGGSIDIVATITINGQTYNASATVTFP